VCTARLCWCIPEVACRNNDKETGSVPHPAAFSLRSQPSLSAPHKNPMHFKERDGFKIIFPFKLSHSMRSLPFSFPTKTLCAFLISPSLPSHFTISRWLKPIFGPSKRKFRFPAIKMKHVFRYAVSAFGSFHHLRYQLITNTIRQDSE